MNKITKGLILGLATMSVGISVEAFSGIAESSQGHDHLSANIDSFDYEKGYGRKESTPIIYKSSMMQNQVCDVAGFQTKIGQSLYDHILSMNYECVDSLGRPEIVTDNIYTSANMEFVAGKAASLSKSYSSATEDLALRKVYSFLRLGYYAEFYNANVGPFTNEVTEAVKQALDSLTNNDDFYTYSNVHGANILDATGVMAEPIHGLKYRNVVTKWLTDLNSEAITHHNIRSVTNKFFTLLFQGVRNLDNFEEAISDDLDLISALSTFARSDWLQADADFLQNNAALELARLLIYSDANIRSTVVTEVNSLLSTYTLNEPSKRAIWASTVRGISLANSCSEFSTCNWVSELESAVLPQRYVCNKNADYVIRSESLTLRQQKLACASANAEEVYFHNKFGTDRNTPVVGDNNQGLELVIFDSRASYQDFAGSIFNIYTNNGGIYLEGDPSDINNQARFLAYEERNGSQI